MKFTEKQLKNYAAPLSDTEEQKCKNAIKMVRDAMELVGYSDEDKEIRKYVSDTYSFILELKDKSGKDITLLVQGSYANNTNVRTESDVDVAVILESTFIPLFREGVSGADYNFSDGTFSANELKNEVENALTMKFSVDEVNRGDKSIKVHGNSYRVDADVVPSYRNRDYREDYSNDPNNYVGGIEIRPDSGGKIINYPEQHIKRGKDKNNNTNYYFKKNVRIIKKMKCILAENSYLIADDVSSFGLESLLWNIPNSIFTRYTSYRFTFDEILIYLVDHLSDFNSYKEANGIKLLFNDHDVENYRSFIMRLNEFYEYDN